MSSSSDYIDCECGSRVLKTSWGMHSKTRKHLSFVNGEPTIIHCPCGGKYVPSSKAGHLRRKSHMEYRKSGKAPHRPCIGFGKRGAKVSELTKDQVEARREYFREYQRRLRAERRAKKIK